MNVTMLRRVRKLYTNPLAPVHTQRHNMRAWIKSVRELGSRWLLSDTVGCEYGR